MRHRASLTRIIIVGPNQHKTELNLVQKLTMPLQVTRILTAQGLITFGASAATLAIEVELALSVLLGGLICTLPNVYFARQLFTKRRNAEPHSLLRSIYVAEIIKVVLAIALFAIVFINYKEVHALPLFATYFIVHACTWAAPLIKYKANQQNIRPTQ